MDDIEKLLEAISLDERGLISQFASIGSIVNIFLAAVFGFLILFIYLLVTDKSTRDMSLSLTLPVLTILMTVIMRMQGGKVAIFFGIFGILSIVRFRSELTDQKGITFILFSIIIGLLLGIGNYILTLMAYIIIAIVIFIIKSYFKPINKYFLVVTTQLSFDVAKKMTEDILKSKSISFKIFYIIGKCEFSLKRNQKEDYKRIIYEIFYNDYNEIMNIYEFLHNSLKDSNIELEMRHKLDF
ncbi:MAG: hypothetical protein A2086_15545 [Spirochaetes bacterium GWD1_27_9]|nr:MAG: hypothetical protein A2Z98_14990 [Spirochaetes bacterium GWB1_27_13]OHD27671.1 MAG: hypothetical protein A2Y34_07300 [Spirochaetes bacterium GWC1_27_15]OHD42796.1 MAG: hypothetical protein A2086_15545 [Spirochaetes bacterium GWD1_27_9]